MSWTTDHSFRSRFRCCFRDLHMKTLRLDAWLDTMSKGSEAIVDNDQTRIKQKVNVKKVNIGGGESPT